MTSHSVSESASMSHFLLFGVLIAQSVQLEEIHCWLSAKTSLTSNFRRWESLFLLQPRPRAYRSSNSGYEAALGLHWSPAIGLWETKAFLYLLLWIIMKEAVRFVMVQILAPLSMCEQRHNTDQWLCNDPFSKPVYAGSGHVYENSSFKLCTMIMY